MRTYKRIEQFIAAYIAHNYRSPVEVGIGSNFTCALRLKEYGIPVRVTDIRDIPCPEDLQIRTDDIFTPTLSMYDDADLVYSIRPGIEMIPPLISLARLIGCDLLVYHLGGELYLNGGEVIDCGAVLHRYHTGQNLSNSVD